MAETSGTGPVLGQQSLADEIATLVSDPAAYKRKRVKSAIAASTKLINMLARAGEYEYTYKQISGQRNR